MTKVSKEQVEDFYDDYVGRQEHVGVNLRHYTIVNYLLQHGLRSSHRVLEVGCGIGTLSSLLAKALGKGSLLATDISSKSIEKAQKLNAQDNLKFATSDLSDLDASQPYDFVVLADVLEHIPLSDHQGLFADISRLTHHKSKVVIHIPHPNQIDHLTRTNPGHLQIIDQALRSSDISSAIHDNGFILHRHEEYALYHKQKDYVFIELIKPGETDYVELSKLQIILKKTAHRLRFLLRR